MGVTKSVFELARREIISRDKYFFIRINRLIPKKLENKAQTLICEKCKTKRITPQHHGRDMTRKGSKLVRWRRLLSNEDLELCNEELPLYCPHCENTLEIK